MAPSPPTPGRPAGHPPAADVVVVGAGPVGLLLAGDLCAYGLRVVVVEQLIRPMTESRASTLHARTMEVLAERGVLDRLGPLPDGGPGHFGGIRLDLAAADPGHPYAGQWKCPQPRLEAVLQERALELGAHIRRGERLVRLADLGGHVLAGTVTAGGEEKQLSGSYVVGCDGWQSTVRELAGFTFAGRGATREMLRADIAGIDIPGRRFERLEHGLATAHQWPDGSTRVMVHVFGAEPAARSGDPGFDEVVRAWAQVTGEDIGHGEPLWLNALDDTRRQATQYRKGRVLLAGDAAHVQMPVGGQALNLGLQDAAALGGRLAERLTGRADDTRLDGYHEERHPVGTRTLTNIQAQAFLLLGGHEVDPLREVFGELMRLGPVRRRLARMISGLGFPRTPAAPPLTAAPHAAPSGSSAPSTTTTRDRSFIMGRLENKTALVTGSSRGIGRATAQRLAAEGALVAVHYATNEDAAQETVEQIERDGGRAFAVRAELGVSGDVHELFLGLEHGLKERTGTTALDIVVNNAAVTTPAGVAPEDVTPEEVDRLLAVNVKAPFFIVQRALPLLCDGGRIINISSGLTRVANPEQVAYSMTKGAVEQITLHFARHLAPRGITVNSVAPGITNNGSPVFDIPDAVAQMAQLSAFKRVGEAVDVADVVTFLATHEARWITGAFIDASGGTLLG
ncbi:SDR family oxidoreductase [Streptomyces rectiverticillatus]|uniref:SDR family oxidoreductase n=1 Tax=Streptomyces rectiverticillatus TaxID=173860 RepID=UPI0015C34D10|nr:SDR family oxidoreductase [Streptomyces rectiverticillatus]QLE70926.1 SDR family oxidoreductase [Streptomyces rectiverticillatus]